MYLVPNQATILECMMYLLVFFQHGLQAWFAGSLHFFHHGPSLVDLESWHGLDSAFGSNFFSLINIHLEEFDSGVFFGEALKDRACLREIF